MLPLEGLKVLDLTRAVPGPYATMLLADMGADVLLVEAPTEIGRSEQDAAFDLLRRNKRSICLDLKRPEGQAILHRLVRDADVFLEGFRPGVIDRLGAGWDTLSRLNERLIFCSLSGYGQTGPYADLPGHDLNYIAIGGALSMIGRPGTPPAIPLQLIGDVAGGGLMAAFTILVALHARGRTGRGQRLDVAMSDGVVSMLSRIAGPFFARGVVPRPGTHRITGALPYYDVYTCGDGRLISIGPLEPHLFRNLCRALELDELQSLGEASPPEAMARARELFRQKFLQKSRDEWFELLRRADTCVAPVLSLDEVFQDPHHLARGMRVEVEHPTLGRLSQVGIAPKLSETPGRVRTAGPRPGADTDLVLAALGVSGEEIERLKSARIAG